MKAYLFYTEPYRKKLEGFHMTFPLIGNNGQHMPAKMINSWSRKVLSMAKTHMSIGTLWGVVPCAALIFPGVHPAGR